MTDASMQGLDEGALRALVPRVLAGLVRRGEDFDAAEDALQEALLEANGEYVDARALAPAQTWVRYGGPDAAPVTTDGPHPETSDLVAGWWMIDVDSHERAVELAAYVSSEPGPGGEPMYEWIDVREIMSHAPLED